MLAAIQDDDRRLWDAMLRDAVRRSGQTFDQAARECETDPKQLAREFRMETGTLRRLAMQPKPFLQWLIVGLAAYYGLPREVKQAYRVHRQSRAYGRMAKMSLPSEQRDRRTA